MPLSSEFRNGLCQIIFSPDHFLARTYGAAIVSAGSRQDRRPILMSEAAAPPNLYSISGNHFLRDQRGILFVVPLPSNFGMSCRKIIFAFHNFTIGTNGTSCTSRSGIDLRLPFMTIFADPPDFSMGGRRDILRRQTNIFGWMPLLDQFRKLCCQCPGEWQYLFPFAIGAS